MSKLTVIVCSHIIILSGYDQIKRKTPLSLKSRYGYRLFCHTDLTDPTDIFVFLVFVLFNKIDEEPEKPRKQQATFIFDNGLNGFYTVSKISRGFKIKTAYSLTAVRLDFRIQP